MDGFWCGCSFDNVAIMPFGWLWCETSRCDVPDSSILKVLLPSCSLRHGMVKSLKKTINSGVFNCALPNIALSGNDIGLDIWPFIGNIWSNFPRRFVISCKPKHEIIPATFGWLLSFDFLSIFYIYFLYFSNIVKKIDIQISFAFEYVNLAVTKTEL